MQRKVRDYKRSKRLARKGRVVRSIAVSDRVRLTVYRSSKHIYAQLLDPQSGRTLAGTSTRSPSLRRELDSSGGVDAAEKVGRAIAEIARERGIEKVVFDRNGFLYHGRVKALADAAREAGLSF